MLLRGLAARAALLHAKASLAAARSAPVHSVLRYHRPPHRVVRGAAQWAHPCPSAGPSAPAARPRKALRRPKSRRRGGRPAALQRLLQREGFAAEEAEAVVQRHPALLQAEDVAAQVQGLVDLGLRRQDVVGMARRWPPLLSCDAARGAARLEAAGFTRAQVLGIVRARPDALGCDAAHALSRLEAAGFARPQGIAMVQACPGLLRLDAVPRMVQLEKAGFTRPEAHAMALACPPLLEHNAEARVLALERSGFTHAQVIAMAVQWPQVLTLDADRSLAQYQSAGLPRGQAIRMAAAFPRLLGYRAEDRLARLEALGFGRAQAIGLVRSLPPVLGYDMRRRMAQLGQALAAADAGLSSRAQGPVVDSCTETVQEAARSLVLQWPLVLRCCVHTQVGPRAMALRARGLPATASALALERSTEWFRSRHDVHPREWQRYLGHFEALQEREGLRRATDGGTASGNAAGQTEAHAGWLEDQQH